MMAQRARRWNIWLLLLYFFAFMIMSICGKGGFYAFQVKDIDGNDVSLETYRGKVALVVNVASECGYTDSHYKELSAMYNELAIEKKQPFTVLGFPCNQFGQQEPHENEDIKEFAKNSYGVRFPLFAKIKVADLSAHPAYRYLKENSGKEPTWNFWKYLVDENGKVVDAWGPRISLETIKPIVLKAIDRSMTKHAEL